MQNLVQKSAALSFIKEQKQTQLPSVSLHSTALSCKLQAGPGTGIIVQRRLKEFRKLGDGLNKENY